ncbi:hypothetical protein CANCADRAFT_73102 [Tortispora caseinolytica NRRL Y-17796]|uniref:Mitochondrial carrier protein n=1 Tax=Tortispora caseinolytica NRRL Y-17796 TaxID=767744 RepID=A0A1E4TIL6_9ASCO|nr:hypothetical protein CANCADRAFT_73102 [Tortispora caseinolytica NRRL Y-17796]
MAPTEGGKTAICASVASVCSTSVGFPFDSVKTRMQAYKFASVWDCVRTTHQTEGLRGFFRGLSAPLVSVTMSRTASFSIYVTMRERFAAALGISPLHSGMRGTDFLISILPCGLAGLSAGAVVTVFACPFEFAKLSAQIEKLMLRSQEAMSPDSISHETPRRGTFQAMKHIIQTKGIGGLYSGFYYHLIRDSIGTGLYFTVYESTKVLLSSPDRPITAQAIAFAGALCGMLSWMFVFPIDTKKSIYQRDILAHGYVRNRKMPMFSRRMYRGLGVSLARTAFTNMTFFSVYELLRAEMELIDNKTVPLDS